jgi:hypothetical protein
MTTKRLRAQAQDTPLDLTHMRIAYIHMYPQYIQHYEEIGHNNST